MFSHLVRAPGVMEYVPLHHTQQILHTNLSVGNRLIHELNQMMPEGQDFITLNNLNVSAFHKLDPEDMKAVLRHYKLYHQRSPSKSTPTTTSMVYLIFICQQPQCTSVILFVNNHQCTLVVLFVNNLQCASVVVFTLTSCSSLQRNSGASSPTIGMSSRHR